MNGRYKALRFLAYAIEIIVLFVIQGTPGFLPEIFGGRPSLLLPVAVTIAVVESETAAMVFGFVCGALTDIGFSQSVGLYTVALTLLCFAFGYAARNFFVTNFLNATVIGVITIVGLFCLHFLIYCVFAGTPAPAGQFVGHYISRIIYTLVFLPPLFWLNRLLNRTIKAG